MSPYELRKRTKIEKIRTFLDVTRQHTVLKTWELQFTMSYGKYMCLSKDSNNAFKDYRQLKRYVSNHDIRHELVPLL